MKKWTIEITEDENNLSINRINDGFNTLELLGFSSIIQSDLLEIMKGNKKKHKRFFD